jgi:hypothetical protein
MAATSKFAQYNKEIKFLLEIGISIRAAWKIINYYLPCEAQMSYNAFYHYVNKHIIL